MIPKIQRSLGSIPPVRRVLTLPSLALASVMVSDGSTVYASSDVLYKGAIFGRDSLTVAEDLMQLKPGLVHNILLTLGRLQGVQTNISNEEEPGKIIHEYRTAIVDGKPIKGRQRQIFNDLSRKWGGDNNVLAYYASVDATPHYLRALHAYCRRYGNEILDEHITQRDGKRVTMRYVADRAMRWLFDKLDDSRSGLLEYQRRNPESFLNHVWKDSNEFYVHENREPVNHDQPIASIEVQGLVYDALIAAAEFFPEEAEEALAYAKTLRDRTVELLWQPDRQYFALGLDYAADGSMRIIRTVTSNPASLLDSAFFDDMPELERQQYIGALVRRIMGSDFLTNAGVRSRSLAGAHLVSFWDYHGSYVSWPKDTYAIARGLRRQGFPRLAHQLENRLVNLVRRTRDYPEFVYVDGWGRVLPGIPKSIPSRATVTVEGSNAPERIQAWTVSAIMAIMARRSPMRSRRHSLAQGSWQQQLEGQILDTIPKMNAYLNPFRLWLQYPTHTYRLNRPQTA